MRTRMIPLCAALAALAVGAAGAAPSASAAMGPSAAAKTATPYSDVSAILQQLTTTDGAPGALAVISDAPGRTVLTSGVADVATGAPMAPDSRFRIGSMTKMFVSTVVLQLVAEHQVGLDTPIDKYLPGLVRGNGDDGRDITVRDLLQQTSGLPDYVDYLSEQSIMADPLATYSPQDLLNLALAHPALFAPGTAWNYSNTNYVLAGLLVQAVTGRP